MEDAHAVELDLDETDEKDTNAFFAVYDGHGGASYQLFFSTVLQLRSRSPTLINRLYGGPLCRRERAQATDYRTGILKGRISGSIEASIPRYR